MKTRLTFGFSARAAFQMVLILMTGHFLGGCAGQLPSEMDKLKSEIRNIRTEVEQIRSDIKTKGFDKHMQVVMEEIYYAFYCDRDIIYLEPELKVPQVTYTLTTLVGVDVGIQVAPSPNVSPSIQRTHDMVIQINLEPHDVQNPPKKVIDNCATIRKKHQIRESSAQSGSSPPQQPNIK